MFVFDLKNMSHPRTAVRGNWLGAGGMLLAMVVTLFKVSGAGWWAILLGLVVGGLVGAALAVRIGDAQLVGNRFTIARGADEVAYVELLPIGPGADDASRTQKTESAEPHSLNNRIKLKWVI